MSFNLFNIKFRRVLASGRNYRAWGEEEVKNVFDVQ
jgi:hypothetical protein